MSLPRRFEYHIAGNAVGLASFTVLLYDQLLTFSDEVNYVWCNEKKWNRGTILFFINRYLHPLAFSVQLSAYFSPLFTTNVCDHFSRFEGATLCVSMGIAGLMMILRVRALYKDSKRYTLVTVIVCALWSIQIGGFAFFLSGSQLPPKDGITEECGFIFKPSLGRLDILPIVATLLFDTSILTLVVFRTVTFEDLLRRLGRKSSPTQCAFLDLTRKTMLQESVIYYCVIFTVNLSLTIMIATSAPGIRNVLGQFSELITATMMSRITLHLRKTYKNPTENIPVLMATGCEDVGLP